MTTASIPISQLRTRARIAAWSIWDNHVNPLATHPDDVPWHGAALTAEWLTAVLAAETPGAEVTHFEIVGGDDGSSVRRRLHLDWNTAGQLAGLLYALFTKMTPTLATRLSAGIAATSEGRFLTELLPHLDVEAPICFHSARSEASGRSIHVMEDLGITKGAEFCNAFTEISEHQAERMIDTLALLHGTFLDPACELDASWLARYEDFHRAAEKSGIRDGHEQAMDKAAGVIPAAVFAARDRIWPAAEQALSTHDEGRTVIHSDVHPGNWYQTSEGQMGLCDWARTCRGHWARDLSYVLMSALSTADRRSWERALINRYLERLQEIADVAVSFDDAWLAYRRQSFAALLMWTPTLCPPAMLPDMQPEDVSMLMVERITTAMDDLEVFNLP